MHVSVHLSHNNTGRQARASVFSNPVCAVALWSIFLSWEQAVMWNCTQSVGLHCRTATVVMPWGHVAWLAAM